MAPGQAPTAVSRPKIFGVMPENVASILKQRRLVTLGGTIDFHINSGEGTLLVHEHAAGITVQSVFGLLLALESF